MQYSIVNNNKLERTYRFDAEYYSKHYLEYDARLLNKKCSSLTWFCDISDGNHMKISDKFEEDGIPYFRGQDLSSFFIENASPVKIPINVYEMGWMKRSHFKEHDILLSIVGTVGNVSIVTDKLGKTTGSCKIAILRPKDTKYSKYISTFLQCKYGRYQIERNTRGAVQKGLILEDFDQINVFFPDDKFVKMINEYVNKCVELNRMSKLHYKNAEYSLMNELNLANYTPVHIQSYVKNFSETQNAKRFDAEYFHPKYDDIICAIKNATNFDRLSNIITYKKGVEVGSNEYIDEGIPFIRVSNISHKELTEEKYISDILYGNLNKYQPRENEILLTKDGTPGIAYHIYNEPKAMIPSGGILRLTIIKDEISPEYLTLALNSMVVQKQIERVVGGSIIKHWRPDQIECTLIPLIKKSKRDEIDNMIVESRRFRLNSLSLLDVAKKGVEKAIDQNEDIAMYWMQNELQLLGVNINA